MKGINFFVLFILCSIFVSAQIPGDSGPHGPGPRDWWYTLERGKVMFRQGDYGKALLVFEDARRQRRAIYERMERDFVDVLSGREVRRIGDPLDRVESYIQERHFSAAAALEELYYRIPKESLNNSAAAALAALGRLKDYPEAEYWIGEVYFAEGELGLALSQFQKALSMRSLFENPGFATELQYKIAGIRRIRQEYTEMERALLLILAADSLWSDDGRRESPGIPQPDTGEAIPAEFSGSFARLAMVRTLENNGINRFITMYRYNNAESAEAHRLLGFYYHNTGRYGRAHEHLMFAFLIQNTVIIEEIIRRQYDFTFTTLEALSAGINRNSLLSEYAEKNEYYKTAYYLGASLYGNGKTAAARDIWNFLSTQNRAGEWQARAVSQLRSPRVERAQEMP